MSIELDRAAAVPAVDNSHLTSPLSRRGNTDVFPLLADGVVLLVLCFVAGIPQPGWVAATGLGLLGMSGAYRRRLPLSTLDVTPRIAAASAATAATVSLSGGALEFAGFAAVGGCVFVATITGRNLGYAIERRLRRNGTLRRRTAIVGAGPVSSLLLETLRAEPGYGLHGIAVPIHPSPQSLGELLRAHRVDMAIIAAPLTEGGAMSDMDEISGVDCEVFFVPQFWHLSPVSGAMQRIGAIPIVPVGGRRNAGPLWQLKLAMDRGLAGAALVALAPLLAALAAAVYLSDTSAPVLFRQKRVGLNGREFELLKFRSLRPLNEHESQTTWSISGDSRLSRFGRLLRASSLDELPQLWNVLRGDMTLVGPRPERPLFVEQFSASVPGYAARHRVPVGLTGWAAVNGLRGDTSIAERARYDNYYIANWSLWFDLTILLRTVVAVVANFRQDRRNACAGATGASCPTR